MVDPEFERRLERLFEAAPPFADEAAFSEQVTRRLNRSWALRRWLIAGAGVVGGLVSVSQLVATGVLRQIQLAAGAAGALSSDLAQTLGQWIAILPGDRPVVWSAIAVALVLLGFVATRVLEEI